MGTLQRERRLGVLVALMIASAIALVVAAQTATGTTATSSTATATLVPPRPIGITEVAFPATATLAAAIEVVVRIRVDEKGEVSESELIQSAGAPFDAAVLEGVCAFRFEPAQWMGTPVPVDVRFKQRFEPPLMSVVRDPHAPSRETGALAGRLRERGTRLPVPHATVVAITGDVKTSTDSSVTGRFELRVPEGETIIQITAAGFRRFMQKEEIRAGEKLEVEYLVERSIRNPYEIIVTGRPPRAEVSRTVLRDAEIKQVPGTFGDPFRVINSLPGVSMVNSLLPFPIVRGSSPGNTGFLIDGIRVPLLFHLLAGPSVVHPELIDEIEFSPGGFPVEYGGYIGGIVDGKTRSARAGEINYDLDLNLFQTGLLARRPLEVIPGVATVAGRIGYPGVIVSLANPRVSLNYWDYQARYDVGDRHSGFTLFAFGGQDELDSVPAGMPDDAPKVPVFHFNFHRIDLRYHHDDGDLAGNYQVTLGADSSVAQDDAAVDSWSVTPRLRLDHKLSPAFTLRYGIDALMKYGTFDVGDQGAGVTGELLGSNAEPDGWLYSIGGLVESIITPTKDLVIRPGIRADLYYDSNTSQLSFDPRILARYRVAPEVWLKGGAGLYHQPPRFTVPLPGLDQIAFERGLLASIQTTAGAEIELTSGMSLDVATYFNWMDPLLYDLQLNPDVDDVQRAPPTAPPGVEPETPPRAGGIRGRLDELLAPATGRSYGVEFLLRRKSTTELSGWIAYTLSRSERLREGTWEAFDFDRTHILNLVLLLPLPRRWQLGLRVQMLAGRPVTTTAGLAEARTGSFIRFDLRLDKTAIWNDWLLDFYVDISNAALGAEELAPNTLVPYVLPSLGFRAIF